MSDDALPEIAAKYRDLRERFDRLLRGRTVGLAVFELKRRIEANARWSVLDEGTWRLHGSESRWNTLGAAVPELLAAGGWHLLSRAADHSRIRLGFDEIESTALAYAVDDVDVGGREHRARNHLAAAVLQLRLLQEESTLTAEGLKRVENVHELLQRAGAAQDPAQRDPDRP